MKKKPIKQYDLKTEIRLSHYLEHDLLNSESEEISKDVR